MHVSGRIGGTKRLVFSQDLPNFGSTRAEAIAGAHIEKATCRVAVDPIQVPLDQRHHNVSEETASRHPLVVVPASVGIGTIQLALREDFEEPVEEFFMADVHSESDLGLPPIAAKVALCDEESDNEAFLKWSEADRTFHGKHDGETLA